MKKLLLFFLMVGITSCDEQSDNNVSGVIMPLKVGNYWTFVDSSFDTNGLLVFTDTSTLSITGKKTIEYQSSSYEVFLWTWTTSPVHGYSWLAWNGEEGMYMFGGSSPKRDYVLTKSLSTKYPVNINEQWERYNITFTTLDSSFKIMDTTMMSCTSKNAVFATSQQEFSCYTYQYSRSLSKLAKSSYDGIDFIHHDIHLDKNTSSTRTTTLYYVPDIGYIGYIERTDGVITFKKTILSYLANKE